MLVGDVDEQEDELDGHNGADAQQKRDQTPKTHHGVEQSECDCKCRNYAVA
jgi:hypothetical protein